MLAEQQKRGRKAHCSRQLLQEAKWYTHSTADFDRAGAKLAELRRMLEAEKDPHPRGQVESDGSYACCTEQWFLKLDYTIDELISLGLKLQEPAHPVKLLERINSPEKLTAYLDAVITSDVRRTGIDTRTELNHSSSALARIILWDDTWSEIPTKFELDPRLKKAFVHYLDEKWQDPETGYWGTWYRQADGSVVKTSDLSMTFHLVSYREGHVKHLPEIVRTTLSIRDQEYPYGWLEDGRMTNHHNYDVVTLLRLGWEHADDQQKVSSPARDSEDARLVPGRVDGGGWDVQAERRIDGGRCFLFRHVVSRRDRLLRQEQAVLDERGISRGGCAAKEDPRPCRRVGLGRSGSTMGDVDLVDGGMKGLGFRVEG